MAEKEKAAITAAIPTVQHKDSDSQLDTQEKSYISSESLAEKVAVKGYTITPDALSENILPIDGLSSKMQEVISQYTDAYQCPREYIVTAIFAAAGVALGKKVSIFDGLFWNNPCLWLVNVGRSSANKTAPTKAIMKPIIEAQQAGYNAFSEAYSQWERDNAGKKKDERNEADKPVWNTQLYISKGSAEGRYKAMQDNPNGVLMWADELATFFGNLGRYNNGDDATELLNFFDGTSSPINIKSEIPKMLENPFMSIFGGIQPGILGKVFGSDSFLNNGLNQRVLFAFPDSYPSVDISQRKQISREIKEYWSNTIQSLLEDAGGTLILDSDAEGLYFSFCKECQKKAEATEDDYEASLYGKLRPNVLRWAAVAHYLSDNRGMTRVTPTVMDYSIRCMRYFATTGAKVYEHLKRGNLPRVKPMGNQELISELAKRYKISSQSDLAKVLGIKQKNVSIAINKFK